MRNLFREYNISKGNRIALYVIAGLAVAMLVFALLFYALMPRPYSLKFFDPAPNIYTPKYKKVNQYNYFFEHNEDLTVAPEFYDIVRSGEWEKYDNIYKYDYKNEYLTHNGNADILLYQTKITDPAIREKGIDDVMVTYDESLPSHTYYPVLYILNKYETLTRDDYSPMGCQLRAEGDDKVQTIIATEGSGKRSKNNKELRLFLNENNYLFPTMRYYYFDFVLHLVCSPDLTVENWDVYCDENDRDHRIYFFFRDSQITERYFF